MHPHAEPYATGNTYPLYRTNVYGDPQDSPVYKSLQFAPVLVDLISEIIHNKRMIKQTGIYEVLTIDGDKEVVNSWSEIKEFFDDYCEAVGAEDCEIVVRYCKEIE